MLSEHPAPRKAPGDALLLPGGKAAYPAAVDAQRLLDELLSAARKLGLKVRIEPLRTTTGSAGGLCRIHGQTLVLLDELAGPVEQAAALAEALGQLDVENVQMAPEARRTIEATQRHEMWRVSDARPERDRVRPLPIPKPGLRRARGRDDDDK